MTFEAPYDLATFTKAINSISPNETTFMDRGEVFQAWIELGAKNRKQRDASLKSFLESGKVFGEDNTSAPLGLRGYDVPKSAKTDEFREKVYLAQVEKDNEGFIVKLKNGVLFQYLMRPAPSEGETQQEMLARLKSPRADTKCLIHYEGRLVDGKVFDSSFARGEPMEMAPKSLIKAWQTMLLMMMEATKVKLFCPFVTAYGPKIPGMPPTQSGLEGKTLIFELELIKVNFQEGEKEKTGEDAMKLLELYKA